MMINQYIHQDADAGIEFLSEVHFRFDAPGKSHTHRETQFLAVIKGVVDVRIGSNVARLSTGDVAVLRPRVPHTVPATGDAQTVDLLDLRITGSSKAELPSFVRSQDWPTLTRVSVHELRRLAGQFATATSRPSAGARAAMLGGVWTLLSLIAAATDSANAATVERRIAVAERFMLEHLAEPVSAEQIAEACALSVSQLNRLFRAYVGTGPAERLRALRVQRAQELLVASLLSVKEIAFDCGFVCPNHFCRVFKTEVGLTPGAYRERGGAWVRA
jgi:AraC family transcriptional regulator, arabinose operon regulatory protein